MAGRGRGKGKGQGKGKEKEKQKGKEVKGKGKEKEKHKGKEKKHDGQGDDDPNMGMQRLTIQMNELVRRWSSSVRIRPKSGIDNLTGQIHNLLGRWSSTVEIKPIREAGPLIISGSTSSASAVVISKRPAETTTAEEVRSSGNNEAETGTAGGDGDSGDRETGIGTARGDGDSDDKEAGTGTDGGDGDSEDTEAGTGTTGGDGDSGDKEAGTGTAGEDGHSEDTEAGTGTTGGEGSARSSSHSGEATSEYLGVEATLNQVLQATMPRVFEDLGMPDKRDPIPSTHFSPEIIGQVLYSLRLTSQDKDTFKISRKSIAGEVRLPPQDGQGRYLKQRITLVDKEGMEMGLLATYNQQSNSYMLRGSSWPKFLQKFDLKPGDWIYLYGSPFEFRWKILFVKRESVRIE